MELEIVFKLVGPLGLVNFLLLSWQLSSGLGWVMATPGLHRKTGILLCCTASLHALLAVLSHES